MESKEKGMTSPSPPTKKNAFSVLMSTKSTPRRKGTTQGRKRRRENGIGRGGVGSSPSPSSSSTTTSASKFVECPGCNRLVAYATIHIHLDKCLVAASNTTEQRNDAKVTHVNGGKDMMSNNTTKSFLHDESESSDHHATKKQKPTRSSSETEIMIESSGHENISIHDDGSNKHHTDNHATIKKRKISCNESQKKTVNANANTTSSGQTNNDNAFRLMMRHSKDFYEQEQSKSKLKQMEQQWFHLTERGDVRWLLPHSHDGSNSNSDNVSKECDASVMVNDLDVKWSSTVTIHASREEKESRSASSSSHTMKTDLRDIELHITSSIPSDVEYRPLVERTSKFSVPVLKSILQKNIRRRRPLPSVRVAMELADKSMGDLLRRLPIICLEDSFLHPDVPFLVWLMVAYSKDFIPPHALVVRLMRVAFEIASCPWRDECKLSLDVPSQLLQEENTMRSYVYNLTSSQRFHADEDCDLMLRCMLLRKKYGGMKCDVKMIDEYVQLWGKRYAPEANEGSGATTAGIATSLIDSKLIGACLPKLYVQKENGHMDRHEDDKEGNPTQKQIQWKQIPRILHSHPIDTSMKLIPPLVQSKLFRLKMHDIAQAGIDFHCSNALDVPLSNPSYVSKAEQILGRKVHKEELARILKTACWNCSAGVNLRRVFKILTHSSNSSAAVSGDDGNDEKCDTDGRNKRIWHEAFPFVNQFVQTYIERRLAK